MLCPIGFCYLSARAKGYVIDVINLEWYLFVVDPYFHHPHHPRHQQIDLDRLVCLARELETNSINQ